MTTTVINLLGGPGCGKSTTAAELFAFMKTQLMSVELVREYVKAWAWDGVAVGPFDQLYILGKQARYESRLYGKVDYVVTDSPFMLSAIYENFYRGRDIVLPTVLRYIRFAQENGVTYKNYLLDRNKPYVAKGRYEDEQTAKRVDQSIHSFLLDHGMEYKQVAGASEIIADLGLNGVNQ